MDYRLVQQKEDFDNAIACIAMLTQKTYSEVREQIRQDEESLSCPLSHMEGEQLMKDLGYEARPVFGLLPGQPSIIVVPSLNRTARMHTIFWDGKETVLDPQEGRSGKLYYTFELMLKAFAYSVVLINNEEYL